MARLDRRLIYRYVKFLSNSAAQVMSLLQGFRSGLGVWMGIFSKLNFRAVHEAYCDVTAVNFLAELVCLVFDAANEPNQTVVIGPSVDRAVQENANSIFLLTNGSGMNHAAGISRLSEVSSSYKRLLLVEFGGEAEVVSVTKYCWEHFNVASKKVVQAVYNGYLSMSASDVLMLIHMNEKRMHEAAHKFAKRNDDYIDSLDKTIKDKEASFRHYQNVAADQPINNQRQGITEKSDRAVHRRSSIDEPSNNQRQGITEKSDRAVHRRSSIDEPSNNQRQAFTEKSDSAVHRRSPIDEPKPSDASPEKTQSKDIEPPLLIGDNYYLARCPKCRQRVSAQIHTITTIDCPACSYSWDQSIG